MLVDEDVSYEFFGVMLFNYHWFVAHSLPPLRRTGLVLAILELAPLKSIRAQAMRQSSVDTLIPTVQVPLVTVASPAGERLAVGAQGVAMTDMEWPSRHGELVVVAVLVDQPLVQAMSSAPKQTEEGQT